MLRARPCPGRSSSDQAADSWNWNCETARSDEGFFAWPPDKACRDKLHKLLKDNNFLFQRKDKRVRTTNSEHCYYKYPNRAKNLIPKRPNTFWVADMTYIPLGSHFVYLSVILDAYSRKIIGWHLDKTM